jgi:2-polyprenyl-3-methyl-5-hydroxy-6-metoxy-1,4-benzoquinol methylase
MRPLAEHTTETPLSSRTRPPIPHYEDADVHASSDEYAARFGDAIGQWMLIAQEKALFSLVDHECTTVLDVGGGHGQIAIPLANTERSVTVLGSSPVCAARLSSQIEQGTISFQSGNLLELPYEDRSFDLTTSFRLISHCVAWRQLIAELCRVSEHAVIIDYPVWFSVNILTPLLFSLKRSIEGNTRTYRMFSTWELSQEFKKHGFRLEKSEKLFVWPMALHRALKSTTISSKLEAPARAMFLTKLFGSPVVAKFVREK